MVTVTNLYFNCLQYFVELFIYGKLLVTSFWLKIILFVMPADKKKFLSFLSPREARISAHDSGL